MTRLVRATLLLTALLIGCTTEPVIKQEGPDPVRVAQVNTQLAIEYMKEGKNEIALERLNRALQADSNYVDAHMTLGLLYSRLKLDDDAERSFQRALRIDPENSLALNNYGQFLCNRGRVDDAMQKFLAAAGNPLYPTPEVALSNAGTCALGDGRIEEAETHLRDALRANPRVAPALLQMAKITFETGRPLPARGYLSRYSEIAKQTPASLWLAIRVEEALGDRDALSSYEMLLQNSYPDSDEARQLQLRRSGSPR
ncbi:MAG: type IV pilus biogenesis/stability protein PilW [Gammaproteobacteria bacterium]|nr:type IV pilus biogenesis/stability protein PilW [Gammaproteobacteria bacterium]NNM00747.1 type IV pilus biogenesis/stability protein PilW [Gammaproteobacteria bacterium]